MSDPFGLACHLPPVALPEAYPGTLTDPASYPGACLSARDAATGLDENGHVVDALPEWMREEHDAEEEQARTLLAEIQEELPPGKGAALIHLKALRRAYADTATGLPAIYSRQQDAVRGSLAPVVALAAALNEWIATADHGPLEYAGWDDEEPLRVLRDTPSLALLIHDAKSVYRRAVIHPDDAVFVEDAIRILWDTYGLGHAELQSRYEARDACREVLYLLRDIARTHELARVARLGIAAADHLTEALSLGEDVGTRNSDLATKQAAPADGPSGLGPDRQGSAAPLRPYLRAAMQAESDRPWIERGLSPLAALRKAWEEHCEGDDEARQYLYSLPERLRPTQVSDQAMRGHRRAAREAKG
jgi:hypothetical protein